MNSKHCEKDKILNPSSGRCVLKTGKIGKELLKKKSNKLSPRKGMEQKCDKDKILNPSSGRCVLKTGKIGKELLKKKSKKTNKSPKVSPMISPKLPLRISRKKSPIISSEWEYENILENTLLFRGSKKPQLLKNRATYFAPSITTANLYLPAAKAGHLCIYKTTKDLKLLKLDSIKNINKILEKTFDDKTKVYKNYTFYEIFRKAFTHQYIVNDKSPYKLKKITRNSFTNSDIIISNWLCDQNFNGYISDILPQKFGDGFPAEIMLCNPKDSIELIKEISMKKTKNEKVLHKIMNELK
jgi:hypothetical protein